MASSQTSGFTLTGAPSFKFKRAEQGDTVTLFKGEAIDGHGLDLATLSDAERKLFTRTPASAATAAPSEATSKAA